MELRSRKTLDKVSIIPCCYEQTIAQRTVWRKLRSARHVVRAKRIALLDQLSLAADAIELKYSIAIDLRAVLAELLEASNPAHYTVSRPPEKSKK